MPDSPTRILLLEQTLKELERIVSDMHPENPNAIDYYSAMDRVAELAATIRMWSPPV